MAYVVTDECVGCKYTDCVDVCPVSCFHEGPEMLYINPEECIDCNACVSECPPEAIWVDIDLPEDKLQWIEINGEMSNKYPVIFESRGTKGEPNEAPTEPSSQPS
ncbi:ferredoxin family protein [Streptomyces brevispora]|uniref:4Fe-4S dicluster domain-containing protein n=1 Tax=Streptomyces brevispora TaxID=887462 RepID=UPI0033D76B6B